MDIERICRTHISTGELTPSSDLIQGESRPEEQSCLAIAFHGPPPHRIAHILPRCRGPKLMPCTDAGLNEGKVILSQVVRGLGGFLTAEDDSVRHRGE